MHRPLCTLQQSLFIALILFGNNNNSSLVMGFVRMYHHAAAPFQITRLSTTRQQQRAKHIRCFASINSSSYQRRNPRFGGDSIHKRKKDIPWSSLSMKTFAANNDQMGSSLLLPKNGLLYPGSFLSSSTSSKIRLDTTRRFVTSQKISETENPKESNSTTMSSKTLGSSSMSQLYAELQSVSSQLRHHDVLYYTPGSQPEISDDDYDALAIQERRICTNHPELRKKLEAETGLGFKATRFGGRVGPITVEDSASSNHNSNGLNQFPEEDGDASAAKEERMPQSTKLEHITGMPMLSLDNAMNEEEVIKWAERIRKLLAKQYEDGEDARVKNSTSIADNTQHASNSTPNMIQILAEPKMDGLSLSLRYVLVPFDRDLNTDETTNHTLERGEYVLKWAASRGDGRIGEDVTEAVMQIPSSTIPKSFPVHRITTDSDSSPPPPIIEVRGEIILPKSAFEQQQTQTWMDRNDTVTEDVSDAHDTNHNPPAVSFANARNAASGILRRTRNLSSNESKALCSSLQFFAYDFACTDPGTNMLGSSASQMRESLKQLGFMVPNPIAECSLPMIINDDDEITYTEQHDLLTNLFQFHESLIQTRSTLDFEVDGAVYKLDDFAYRNTCGSSNRAPRWAVAHKFPSMQAVSKILGVDVQVGRTGAITPVANLQPVDIGGTTVSRATLHNFNFAAAVLADSSFPDEDDDGSSRMNSKDRSPLVKVGTSVLVARAGDVIPKVVRRLDQDGTMNESENTNYEETESSSEEKDEWISLEPPSHCPACGAVTVFDTVDQVRKGKSDSGRGEDDVEDEKAVDDGEADDGSKKNVGQVLRCGGPQLFCEPRAVGALSHAFSRAALDVPGLSDARVAQLKSAGILNQPSDLFLLVEESQKPNDNNGTSQAMLDSIASLPGWGEKSAKNLAAAAQAVSEKGTKLDRFIFSLGIRHAGSFSSKLIASAYGSANAFLEAVEDAGQNSTTPFALLVNDDENDGVKGIGPVLISSLLNFSKEKMLVKAAKDLAAAINVLDEASEIALPPTSSSNAPLPFDGLTVVFTGSIPDMSRSSAQEMAKLLGAKSTPGSVSKSTDIVVEGDKGGKKADKARTLGIRIMDLSEFLKIVQESKR